MIYVSYMKTYLITTDTNQVSLIAKDEQQAKDYYKKLHGEYNWIELLDYQFLYNK